MRIPPSPSSRPSHRPYPVDSSLESARFFDIVDGQLYTVTHAAQGALRGAVLLCGPFGVEREHAYLTHVLWARTLAARGFEVMRFDYRGHGESTGSFEDMTLLRWREDAAFCAARLATVRQGVALILQGTRLGALIAAELFASGVGDGLLLWAAPVSAEALLRDALRHTLVAQSMASPDAPRQVREQLIQALEAGKLVNVDGYFWTLALWKEALGHPLLLPPAGEKRPWHALEAGSVVATGPGQSIRPRVVDADTFWQSSSPLLVPHHEGFFQESLRWLDENEPWRVRGA